MEFPEGGAKGTDIFWNHTFEKNKDSRNPKGRFRWYDFCLQLSHATSVAHAACAMQKMVYNTFHLMLPIPMTVIWF